VVGMSVTGPGVPPGTTITAIGGATQIDVSGVISVVSPASIPAAIAIRLKFTDQKRITLSAAATSNGTTSLTFTVINPTTLGNIGGVASQAMSYAQLAMHAHPTSTAELPHDHEIEARWLAGTGGGAPSGGSAIDNKAPACTDELTGASTGVEQVGENAPINNLQPTMLMSIYMKL